MLMEAGASTIVCQRFEAVKMLTFIRSSRLRSARFGCFGSAGFCWAAAVPGQNRVIVRRSASAPIIARAFWSNAISHASLGRARLFLKHAHNWIHSDISRNGYAVRE